jgi:predicted MPP superfamily phosphohydrolase
LQGFYLSLFGVSGALAGLGLLEVVRGPKIKKTLLAVENLPPSLQGLKIAQISDLHVGLTIRKGYVEEVVRLMNETNPDFIFLTGDITDAPINSIAEHLKPLSNLKSKYGTFYITGNHEYYWDIESIIEAMKALGFTLLLNENRTLKIGDSKILIAGITDPAGEHGLPGHAPSMSRSIAALDETAFKILLAHRPDACVEAEALGFDLQFSGHTHAGQFFPFSLLIGLAHKYTKGLYRHGRMWVYVNPGTGYWGPADRLGIRAEISLVTLGKVS